MHSSSIQSLSQLLHGEGPRGLGRWLDFEHARFLGEWVDAFLCWSCGLRLQLQVLGVFFCFKFNMPASLKLLLFLDLRLVGILVLWNCGLLQLQVQHACKLEVEDASLLDLTQSDAEVRFDNTPYMPASLKLPLFLVSAQATLKRETLPRSLARRHPRPLGLQGSSSASSSTCLQA